MNFIKKLSHQSLMRTFMLHVLAFSLVFFIISVISKGILLASGIDQNLFTLIWGDLPHGVQLEYSFKLTFVPLLVTLLALISTKMRVGSELKIGLLGRASRPFRFGLYYLTLITFIHWMTWWVIKPGCVGCMTDDGVYSLGVAFFVSLVILGAILISFLLFILTSKVFFKEVFKELLYFVIFLTVILFSNPLSAGYLLLVGVFHIALLWDIVNGEVESFERFWTFVDVS